MRLRIITPLSVVVDEEISSLRAEDATGGFGILNGHAPFLTSLAICVVGWRQSADAAAGERFCAVRGGVITVSGQTGTRIDIATREAVVGDALTTLDADVLARFRSEADAQRVCHVETVKLQLSAIRRMVGRLKLGADAGAFR